MRLNGLKSALSGKRFLACTLLSVFCLASSAANAQALDQLSASDQADIAQKCLPVQYQQGANAYRECVVVEVEKLSEQGNSDTASLSFDEQYAIQQTCGPIANPTESAYQQCVNQEIASLSGEPATQMDSLDDDEIYALQQSCFDTQSTQGVKAYRQCMNAAVLSLQALPNPDLSQLTLLERNALQLRCSAQQTTAADYRSCLLEQVGGSSAELPNAALAPALNDVNTDSLATTGAQSELPALNVETFEPNTDTLADTDTETTAATATDASITQTTDATSIAIAPSASDTLSDIPVTAPVVTETETSTSATINPSTGVNTQTLDSLTAPVTDAVVENSAINTSTTVQAVDIAKPIEPSDNTAIELAQEDSTNLSAVNSTSESVLPADSQSGFIEPSNTAQNTEQSAPADEQTLQGEQSQTATGIALVTAKTKEIWAQLQKSVSELDGTSRVIIFAAMGLPILLIGFWLAIRGKAREPEAPYFDPAQRNPLIDRVGPSQQRRSRVRDETVLRDAAVPRDQTVLRDAAVLRDQTVLRDAAVPRDETVLRDAAVPRDETVLRDAAVPRDETVLREAAVPRDETVLREAAVPRDETVLRGAAVPRDETVLRDVAVPRDETVLRGSANFHEPVEQSDPLNLSQQADDMFGEMPDSTKLQPKVTLDQLSPTEKAGFLAWLNQQPQENRLSLAIEFLIYWMAYGDERYEPAMKEAIFQNPDPDDHDRIKRWVLMQDVYAFSDVVYWLQHNSSIAQRVQVLDLLMALLISENALTPVQNTILRFLGDVFGLGYEQLEQQYQQAFGHAMPPLPRVDKPRWWDGQEIEQRKRWDARTVAAQSLELQYRVKLGLRLRGEINDQEVIASFNRAAARCNPQRFELLGTRERSLMEQQLTKFEYAKESLLEVSA